MGVIRLKVYIAMQCDVEGCGSLNVFDNPKKAKAYVNNKEKEERRSYRQRIKREVNRLKNWRKEWNKELPIIKELYKGDVKEWKKHNKMAVQWDRDRLKETNISGWIYKEYDVQ